MAMILIVHKTCCSN